MNIVEMKFLHFSSKPPHKHTPSLLCRTFFSIIHRHYSTHGHLLHHWSTGLVHHVTCLLHHVNGHFHHVTGLFHHVIGLLHHVTGLLHHVIGLLHHITGLLHHVIGLLHHVTGLLPVTGQHLFLHSRITMQ